MSTYINKCGLSGFLQGSSSKIYVVHRNPTDRKFLPQFLYCPIVYSRSLKFSRTNLCTLGCRSNLSCAGPAHRPRPLLINQNILRSCGYCLQCSQPFYQNDAIEKLKRRKNWIVQGSIKSCKLID